MSEIDLVRLNFSPQSLWGLNFIIGLVMFGVLCYMLINAARKKLS